MKVLIVHPKVPMYGGAERVIVKLCEYMRNHDIEHGLQMPDLPKGMAEDLGTTKVYRLLEALQTKWDIINFHNFPATLSAVNYLDTPMCYLCNEPAELFTNGWRKGLESANRWIVKHKIKNVIVADKFNARRFFDIYDVVPEIIPYGIDYEYFSQVEHSPDPDYFTVLQVGTVTPYKNQLAAICAVSEAKKYIPNIRLWLVGNASDKAYKEQVQDLIRATGMGGITEIIPHSDRAFIRHLYSGADVLLHPVKEQGGWLSPFEAMSVGCYVITSEDLTCKDLILQNGLAEVTDYYSQSLVNAYRWLSTDEWKDNQTRIKQWVAANLTWNKFSESMVNYFKGVIECRRSVSQGSPDFLVRT